MAAEEGLEGFDVTVAMDEIVESFAGGGTVAPLNTAATHTEQGTNDNVNM